MSITTTLTTLPNWITMKKKAKVTSKGIIILLNELTGNEAHHLAEE